jgi:hypothetical protein
VANEQQSGEEYQDDKRDLEISQQKLASLFYGLRPA